MAEERTVVNASKRGVYKGVAAVAAYVLETLLGEIPYVTRPFTALMEWLLSIVASGPGIEVMAAWGASIFLGIVAGDVVALLRGEKPPLGRTAGIVRGLGAFAGALVMLTWKAVTVEPVAVALGIFFGEVLSDMLDKWVL